MTIIEPWPAMIVGRPAAAGLPVSLVGSELRRRAYVSEADARAMGPRHRDWISD